jgi:heat shock protein HslJ/uncharacterized lipoprotein YbaY
MSQFNTLASSTFSVVSWILLGGSVLSAAALPVQSITIKGSLTYLQRIALPADSRALIEVREATAPDSAPVVAEHRVELKGRQVPVPFELSVDRAKLLNGKKFIVRGMILTGDRPAWVSEDIAVDLGSTAVDVGVIRLTPYQAKPVPVEMMCGTEPVMVNADKGAARVVVAGQTLLMTQVPAASGAKYEVAGDPTTSYWSRGPNGTLVVKGTTYPECTPAPASKAPTFRATGNEPGWKLQISADALTLVTEYGAKTTTVRSPSIEPLPDGRRYTGTADGRSVTVTVGDRVCRDTMTGLPRPNIVEVTLDATRLTGCGGDPGALLQGEIWTVQSIAGTPVAATSRVTVSFGADGLVFGTSSCNSYRGPYTIGGEGLSIGQTAGTLKACPPELMTQETAFLSVLRDVRHFDIRPDGALDLKTADGRTIVAVRK